MLNESLRGIAATQRQALAAAATMPIGGRPEPTESERLHVLVRFKLRTGEDPEDVELLWPKGWAIPTQGDTVRHGGLVGLVMGIEYDPERSRITLVTR